MRVQREEDAQEMLAVEHRGGRAAMVAVGDVGLRLSGRELDQARLHGGIVDQPDVVAAAAVVAGSVVGRAIRREPLKGVRECPRCVRNGAVDGADERGGGLDELRPPSRLRLADALVADDGAGRVGVGPDLVDARHAAEADLVDAGAGRIVDAVHVEQVVRNAHAVAGDERPHVGGGAFERGKGVGGDCLLRFRIAVRHGHAEHAFGRPPDERAHFFVAAETRRSWGR